MSNFTKGKWDVIHGAGIDELDVISENKRNICCLFGYSVSRWNEQKANARLIAAAPDMYEELIFAMAALRDGDVCDKKRADKIEALLARIDGDSQED